MADELIERVERGLSAVSKARLQLARLLDTAVTHSALTEDSQLWREGMEAIACLDAAFPKTTDMGTGLPLDAPQQNTRIEPEAADRGDADPVNAEDDLVEREHCNRCGRDYRMWAAPSPLWNAVMRGGCIDGPWEFGEMICANCFMELAEDLGVANTFRVVAESVKVPLQTITPSGRVWDDKHNLWVEAKDAEVLEAVRSTRDGEIERYREALEAVIEANRMGKNTWACCRIARQALNQGTDNVG